MWRSVLVVVLALPGAIYGGIMGGLVGSFAGDASPPPPVFMCIVAGCAMAGALLGSLPGVIVGVFLKVRWVLPLLGAAFGIVISCVLLAIADEYTSFQMTMPGILGACLSVLVFLAPIAVGLFVGIVRWRFLTRQDQKRAASALTGESDAKTGASRN